MQPKPGEWKRNVWIFLVENCKIWKVCYNYFVVCNYGGNMEKVKKGSHLTIEERRQIAMLLDDGFTPYKIARMLGRALNTVLNELRRGTTKVIIKYYEREKYFPDTGQAIYEKNRRNCRVPQKIETCNEYISYVENQVLKERKSFASIRAEVLDRGLFREDEICSVALLYDYTDRGLLRVKNIDLPEKVGRCSRGQGKDRSHKRLHGISIDKRPMLINDRKEFGHWEIDLVIGKKTSDDKVLLTLTERKTKKEIIRKIQGKTVKAVHRCIKNLRREIPYFDKVFKSITTDNGSEFARLYELGEKMGIAVYYAHPYSSWERGQNENCNRIIRRFIPKGEPIKNYTRGKIQEVENWINTLYRRSLGWRTAEAVYREELEKLLGVV